MDLGLVTFENQITGKRFGEAVRENCIKEDPPLPPQKKKKTAQVQTLKS